MQLFIKANVPKWPLLDLAHSPLSLAHILSHTSKVISSSQCIEWELVDLCRLRSEGVSRRGSARLIIGHINMVILLQPFKNFLFGLKLTLNTAKVCLITISYYKL